MITLQVTSDSSVPELKVANRLIGDLIVLREESNAKKNTLTVKFDASDIMPMVNEAIEQAKAEVFNTTELAEAEQLGKPVRSTVAADPSTTAPVDTQANISLPEPTSVFGQHAQTTANVANPAVQNTEHLVRDADGLVWDTRIHSSSRELNKDGTWRKRRGVDDTLLRDVEAELRGGYSPIPAVIASVDVAETSPHHDVQVTVSSPNMTFTELLDGVTKAMVAGQLSQDKINEALAAVGLTALPHLLGNPALIPAFREALGGVV